MSDAEADHVGTGIVIDMEDSEPGEEAQALRPRPDRQVNNDPSISVSHKE